MAAAAAISSPAKGNAWLPRLRALLSLQRFNHTIVDGGSQGEVYADNLSLDKIEFHKWRKLDSRALGINRSMIPAASWTVLRILQSSGFEAYLVGGCVRDLLLNRIPKDFDVITTAALSQIRKKFHHSLIVGRRFPICIVHVKGSVVEVSSFETVAKQAEGKDKFLTSQMPTGCDEQDVLLWRNCMHRDFTINSLFFDPFANKIYDYSNALMDLRSLKLRTLVPAHLSFKEDCARILRALRLAARLNLSISKETDIAIRKLSLSITNLAKARIMMELNYMLSYGAAEPSLCLLQRYSLLEIFLPFHAAHLTEQSHKQSSEGPLMLMKLFSNMDLLVACDRPSDSTLWIALLVFHLALVKDPQHVLVVLTFASLLYHGNWRNAVGYSREHAEAARIYTPEILDSSDILSDDELAERVTRFAGQVKNSVDLLTNTDSLLEAMVKFSGFPCAGLVFVSPKMGAHVKQVVDHLVQKGANVSSLNTKRKSLQIEYTLLGKGDIRETRFVLGRIIIDAMVPKVNSGGEIIKEDKDSLHKIDSSQKVEILKENCQTQLNVEKSSSATKDDRKHKLIGRIMNPPEKISSKRQKVFVDRQQKEMTGNKIDIDMIVDPSRNDDLSLDYVSKEKEVDSCQLPQDEIRMILEDVSYLSGQRDMMVQEAKVVHSKKYQHSAKKHLRILENVNHEVAEKQGTSLQQHDLPPEGSIERKEVVPDSVESNSVCNGVASEKNETHKPEKFHKGSRFRLSSLFN